MPIVTSFNELIQQGSTNAWLFIPSAILLGALHGLEPGHSKTMMAAFIVAIRGTVLQAVLLGVSATLSHTAVIWALAAVGMHYGKQFNAETTEPYLQLASGVLIFGVAAWMFWRTRKEAQLAGGHRHSQGTKGNHGGILIHAGHDSVEISVFETGVPPCFRLYFYNHSDALIPPPLGESVSIEIKKPNGNSQTFHFAQKENYLESTSSIPEPHEFKLFIKIAHGNHSHTYETQFAEEDHHHDLIGYDDDYEDAHQKEHAEEVRSRFTNRTVTTGQIILFGLTGGLLPCPAALTVLLICLQLKRIVLGFTLVACFSIGLAMTLVATGSIAAWSVGHASKKFKGFGKFARKAPYLSCLVLTGVGGYMLFEGWRGLP